MDGTDLIWNFLVVSFAAGATGTALMVLVMTIITRSGLTNADMVRAIGSLLTRSEDSSLLVGGLIHASAGLAFGVVYTFFLQTSGIAGVSALAVAAALGFAHGYVMSMILVSSVAEHHPLPAFRQAGFAVAAAHLVGHVAYGVGVGTVVASTGFSAADFERDLLQRATQIVVAQSELQCKESIQIAGVTLTIPNDKTLARQSSL